MSKLMCGRCGDKVNVNLVPSEYRTQDGVIYCDDYCFKYKNNKRPPKTISVKQDAKLYVVNDANELISLRDKLGFDKDDNSIENLILSENAKKSIPFLQCERGIFLCKKILDFVFI